MTVDNTTADSHESPDRTPPPLVLVVDDDPEVRALLSAVLTPRGLRVVEAGDGRQALELVHAEPPRLIVLDLMMPVMSGEEFMVELERAFSPRPAVILFTAAPEQERIARELSVDVCVEKPVDLTRFVRLVEATLRGGPPPRAKDLDGERRARRRVAHRRPVEIRFSGGRFQRGAFCLDLSEGGMLLELPQSAREGQYVSVAVRLADGQRIELDARVRHADDGGRTGVQFFALDSTSRDGLKRLIDETGG